MRGDSGRIAHVVQAVEERHQIKVGGGKVLRAVGCNVHGRKQSVRHLRNELANLPGSGVDVQTLQPQPEIPGQPTVAFVGRLLADKGIHTLISAHRLLRQKRCEPEKVRAE